MRTLALLAALLLLALQAQAEPLPARPDDAADEEQSTDKDQVATISFTGDESSAFQDEGVRAGVVCYCRGRCHGRERLSGYCRVGNTFYRLCCR